MSTSRTPPRTGSEIRERILPKVQAEAMPVSKEPVGEPVAPEVAAAEAVAGG